MKSHFTEMTHIPNLQFGKHFSAYGDSLTRTWISMAYFVYMYKWCARTTVTYTDIKGPHANLFVILVLC